MAALGASGHPFGGTVRTMRHGVQDQLHAARNPDLVENPKQVLLDCVLAQAKLASHLAIGKAIGDERDYLLFARRQERPAVGIDDAQGRDF